MKTENILFLILLIAGCLFSVSLSSGLRKYEKYSNDDIFLEGANLADSDTDVGTDSEADSNTDAEADSETEANENESSDKNSHFQFIPSNSLSDSWGFLSTKTSISD